jgi:hypothetical protein
LGIRQFFCPLSSQALRFGIMAAFQFPQPGNFIFGCRNLSLQCFYCILLVFLTLPEFIFRLFFYVKQVVKIRKGMKTKRLSTL